MAEYADIALNLPTDQTFTYAIPRGMRDAVRPGVRVKVPFQSRRLDGTCVQLVDEAPSFRVRPIERVLDPFPLYTPVMLRLADWIARRYGAGVGEALDAALPFGVRSGGQRRRISMAHCRVAPNLVAQVVQELEAKHEKQARLLRILADAGEPMVARELCRAAKVTDAPLKSLVGKGFVEITREQEARADLMGEDAESHVPPDLNPWQSTVVETLNGAIASARYKAFLLFGVTGSGKTEVYLRALRECVDRGRQGVVLVPEIALTPQTVSRFRARFGRVAVLHSHLTDSERHDQWRWIQSGEPEVIIGARSAVFAPTPRLGLIVIDEEHEATFKQQNAPRYDAREVARARARFEGAVLVLGSATPSLEAYHRAQRGRLDFLRLPERVGVSLFPETIVADLNQVRPAPGGRSFLSDRLRASLRLCVARKEQAILFLNRRGYATAAICRSCGQAVECDQCDIVLVYHRRVGRLMCHYCGHERRLAPLCDNCQGPFKLAGFGTERVEDELLRAIPEARVARMDSDTMRARGSHEVVLSKFRRGEIDVLVGTQMIAKGLDFPNVTLVGVISADTTLNLPDYRAAERTYSLLSQVAGRAGRGDKPGSVVVQTHRPDHYAIQIALEHDYDKFAKIELEARRKDGYPPFGFLARVVFEGEDEAKVSADADALRTELDLHIDAAEVQILGPAPAPISQIAGRFRYHIVAKSDHRIGLRKVVSIVRSFPRPKGDQRRLLDVDPLSML